MGTPRVNSIIFSKDRPFQLHECIRTLLLAHRGDRAYDSSELHVHVLWQASHRDFELGYDSILTYWALHSKNGGTQVHIQREQNFGSDLCRILDSCSNSPSSCILFVVDDAVWFRTADVLSAAHVLIKNDRIRGALLKLHPGVCYGYPGDESFDPPLLRRLDSFEDDVRPCSRWYAWELPSTGDSKNYHSDFSYPMDLCAGLYRLSDVQRLIRGLLSQSSGATHAVDSSASSEAEVASSTLSLLYQRCSESAVGAPTGLSHPNLFEVALNQQFVREFGRGTENWLICPETPACIVITVNRVQEVFQNAVYGPRSGCEKLLDPHALLAFVRQPTHSSTFPNMNDALTTVGSDGQLVCPVTSHFNDSWYSLKSADWACVHVPDFVTIGCSCCDSSFVLETSPTATVGVIETTCDVHPDPLVSVLVPIYNASLHISRSLSSILNQHYTRIQLVLVDDGSTDNTAEVTVDELCRHGLVRVEKPSKLTCVCPAASDVIYFAIDEAEGCYRSAVLVLLPDNRGVAGALNAGIPYCCGDFIARADADDEYSLDRITVQVNYLTRNCFAQLVGAAVIVVHEQEFLGDLTRPCKDVDAKPRPADFCTFPKVLAPPRHPDLILWRMLTHYCVLSHPTVFARRDVFSNTEIMLGSDEHSSHFYPEGTDTFFAEDYAAWLLAMVPPVGSHVPAVRVSNSGGGPLVTLFKRGQGLRDGRLQSQRRAAIAAATGAIDRFLESNSSIYLESPRTLDVLDHSSIPTSCSLCEESVAILQLGSFALRCWTELPWCRTLPEQDCVPLFAHVCMAFELLQIIENTFVSWLGMRHRSGLVDLESLGTNHSVTKYIRRDVTSRLGELASVAASMYGSEATSLLIAWARRRRDHPT